MVPPSPIPGLIAHGLIDDPLSGNRQRLNVSTPYAGSNPERDIMTIDHIKAVSKKIEETFLSIQNFTRPNTLLC